MIRKRDFILFCLAVFFLLLGIGGTVVSGDGVAKQISPSRFATVDAALRASVATSDIDRAARTRVLREAIAGSELALAEPAVELPESDEGADAATNSDTSGLAPAQQCGTPRPVAISVPPDAQFVEREGARLLVSGAPAAEPEAADEVNVLVQLPARNLPLEGTSCVETDVVGFATDGSPIRNTETGLYGVFGANTLVGYALDGFPIYGTNNTAVLDTCGGVVVGGHYRYYLSDDRSTILGCYSGIPVNL